MNVDLPAVDIKRILYATDLSENARYAMAYAVSMANAYCAQIVILHVIDETPDFVDAHVIGYIGANEWEEIKKRNIDEAREVLIGKKRDNTMIHEVLDRFCENCVPAPTITKSPWTRPWSNGAIRSPRFLPRRRKSIAT